MTFKGFLRELERVQRRAIREEERARKQQLKEQERFNAQEQFENYQAFIHTIKSLHKKVPNTINWREINNKKPPVKPVFSNKIEKAAKAKLKNYVPSFWDKLFRLTPKKINKMEQEIQDAPAKDKAIFDEEMGKYEQAYVKWQEMHEFSEAILAENIPAYQQVFEEVCLPCFKETEEKESPLCAEFQKQYLLVNIMVKNIDNIIPTYVLSLTSTGKLSRKNMPISKRNELYQDYICSYFLAVIRTIFAAIPVPAVLAHAKIEGLNTATGKIEPQIIVSAWIPRETLDKINFDLIDPSDCMKNFICNMKFSKTKGFIPVQPVLPPVDIG